MSNILFSPRRLRFGWRLLLFFAVAIFTELGFFFPVAAPLQWLLTKILTPDSSRAAILQEGILVPALLAASWYMVKIIDRRPWRSLGLPRGAAYIPQLLWGVVLGLALVGIQTLYALLVQGATWESFALNLQTIKLLVFALIAWLGVAFFEELLFRGYFFQTLIEGLGVIPAALLSSLLFGLAHYANAPQHGLYVVDAAALGLVMALMVLKTKALWMAIGFHFANDFFIDFFGWFPQPIPEKMQLDLFSVISDVVLAMLLATVVIFARWIRPTEEMERLFRNSIYPAPWRRLRARLGLKSPPCYRHPDRPTHHICPGCGRAICDECRSSDSAEPGYCPDCEARWRLAHPDLESPSNELPVA